MSEYIFKLPDLGEGTVESEIGEWLVKVGDDVKEEDVVGTMMTDKAAVELSSPVSGKVVKLAGEPGDIVAVGAPLVIFETSGTADEGKPAAGSRNTVGTSRETASDDDPARSETAAGQPNTEPNTELKADAMAGAPTRRPRVVASPAIRRRAKEAGIDLTGVAGSGPSGRIVRADLDQAIERGTSNQPANARGERERAAATKEIKVIGLRRIIAERMSASKREIPHFAYVEEIDITELEALRKHLNESRGNSSERLTILPFLAVALVRALREFPQCNATYDKQKNVIVQHGPVHLGVATQTPDGLKVPVVRDADTRSLYGLADEMRRVSGAARDNSAKKNELTGSTITITSLGKLGGIASTPVINMPEVGIIGVNRAVLRPMVVDGQIAVRLMMNLSSSFDHRFVDGYDAAAMIQRIKDMFEHPATLFMTDQ